MMKWLIRGVILTGVLIPVATFLIPRFGGVDPRLTQAPPPLSREQVAQGQVFKPPAPQQNQVSLQNPPIPQQGGAPVTQAATQSPSLPQAPVASTQPFQQAAPAALPQTASIQPGAPQEISAQQPAAPMGAVGVVNIDPSLLGTPYASTDPIVQCLVREPPPEIHPLRVSQWTPALPQMVLLPHVRFGLDEFNANGDLHSVLDAQISNLIVGQPMRNTCAFLGIELVNARVGAKLPNGEVLVETVHVWRHRDGARACAEQTVRYVMSDDVKQGFLKSHGALWKAEQAYVTGVIIQESGGLPYRQGDPVRCAAAMGDIKIEE